MTRTLALLCSLFASGCLLAPESGECSASNCDECTQLAGCGWCPGRGCVAGDPTGPVYGVDRLSCDDYRWDECTVAPPRVDPCAVHTAADRCVLATSCQWCGVSGSCALDDMPCGWVRTGINPRSSHLYGSSSRRAWLLGVPPRASEIRIQFGRIELEDRYDVIELVDGETIVHTITQNDSERLVTLGRATEIRLRTDASVERWGFEIDWVEYR